MPTAADDILKQLNAPAHTLSEVFSVDILPDHKLGKAAYLFKRIDNTDNKQEIKWQQQFGGHQAPAAAVATTAAAAPAPKLVDNNAKWAASQKKKEAAAAAEANKSAEERDLESKLEAQAARVKDIHFGKAEGDLEAEKARSKQIKTELQELRKKLKAVKI
jgi:methionyl-tRNA synthetase